MASGSRLPIYAAGASTAADTVDVCTGIVRGATGTDGAGAALSPPVPNLLKQIKIRRER